jgi:hypothetical protein
MISHARPSGPAHPFERGTKKRILREMTDD